MPKTKTIKGGKKKLNKSGVILFDRINNKILTISNIFDQNIGLPKGEIRKNEPTKNAAYRELREETGIQRNQVIEANPDKIEPDYGIGGVSFYLAFLDNGSINDRFNNIQPTQKALNENIYNIKWRSFDEIQNLLNVSNFTMKSKDGKGVAGALKQIMQV